MFLTLCQCLYLDRWTCTGTEYGYTNLIMTEAEWPSEIDAACDTLANIIKAALDKSCPKNKFEDMDFFHIQGD